MTSQGSAPRDGQYRYMWLADELRKEIHEGTRLPGQRIPTQEVLAGQYHVSRHTVIQAVNLLREEGLVHVVQGSGTFVREHGEHGEHGEADGPGGTAAATGDPAAAGDESYAVVSENVPQVRLKPYLEEAFEATEVTLDVFSMTTESLATQVSQQKDRILDREIQPPRSITARLLLPDTASDHLAVPRPVDGSDDPRVRVRMHGILRAHATMLRESLYELRNRGFVPEVSVEVRLVAFSPQIKLYILNRRLALQGFYPPELGTVTVPPDSEEVTILDSYGTGATLFPFRASADSTPDQVGIVRQMRKFFENTWNHQATRAEI